MGIATDHSAAADFAYAGFDFVTANTMLADNGLDETAAAAVRERREVARARLRSTRQAAMDALAGVDDAELRRLATQAGVPDATVTTALGVLNADGGKAGLRPRLEEILAEPVTDEELACSQCCGAVIMTISGVLAAPKFPTIGGIAITIGVIGIAGSC